MRNFTYNNTRFVQPKNIFINLTKSGNKSGRCLRSARRDQLIIAYKELFLTAPFFGVTGQIFAAAHGISLRGHVGIVILIEILIGDHRLGQGPASRNLFTLHLTGITRLPPSIIQFALRLVVHWHHRWIGNSVIKFHRIGISAAVQKI